MVTNDCFQYAMKIIKKGQTNPVYSVYTKQSLWTYLITCSKLGIEVSSNVSFFNNPPSLITSNVIERGTMNGKEKFKYIF